MSPAGLQQGILGWALGIAGLCACRPAPPAGAPVETALIGRRLVWADGTHQFDVERRPGLWWADPSVQLHLECATPGGWRRPPQRRATDGPRVQVSALAPCAGLTALRAVDASGRIHRRWPARLGAPPEDPAADPALWAPVAQARALQAAGDLSAAGAAWEAAAEAASAQGARSEAVRRLSAAAWVAEQGQRFSDQARQVALAVAASDPAGDPEGAARLGYTRANLARRLGDFRAAKAGLLAAARDLRRFGDAPTAAVIEEALALLQVELGDLSGAAARLAELAPTLEARGPAARARLALNRGWVALLQAEAEGRPDPRAEAWLAAAQAALPGPEAANAAVNRARLARLAGDQARALALLAEARTLDPAGAGPGAAEARILAAELRLLAGDGAGAAAACAALAATPEAPLEQRWRAQACLGDAAQLRGEPAAAAAAWQAALAEVERQARGAALRQDRGRLLGAHRRLEARAVGALIAQGAAAEAFSLADAARARILRAARGPARVAGLSPEARAAWAAHVEATAQAAAALRVHLAQAELVPEAERPAWEATRASKAAAQAAAFEAAYAWLEAAAPAPPLRGAAPDTVRARLEPDALLVAFAATSTGWQAFALDHGALTVHPAPPEDPLGALLPRIADRTHLYLVPGGHPTALQAPYAGAAPLALRHSLAWLPYAGALRATPGVLEPALVIADPNEDLRHARLEGARVSARLGGAALVGQAARVDAVRAALPGAGLIHFAGHGLLSERDPWAAELRLADGPLGLPEILITPLQAGLVVLSGCTTGPDAALLDEGQLGLAEAFLAAGAARIVATDRAVSDASTRRFMERFYAAGGPAAPAEALRQAAAALQAAGDAEWSAFRLIGRR